MWLQHPSLALGYLHDDATARAFRDGWFCTGDLFTVDEAGCCWHHGRADELMKVAGQWVDPAAVEDAAMQAAGVREAACVVVRDADGFDRLALFVVPAASTAALSAADAAVRAVHSRLPRHCQPRWVREVEEFPRTPTGKLQRFKLRSLLHDELSGVAPPRG